MAATIAAERTALMIFFFIKVSSLLFGFLQKYICVVYIVKFTTKIIGLNYDVL
jgi:hypothetical protein